MKIAKRFGIKPSEILLAKEKQRYNQPDCIDFRDYIENYGKSPGEVKSIEVKNGLDVENIGNGIKIKNGKKPAWGKLEKLDVNDTPTIKSIPISLIDKSIRTIANYLASRGFSKRNAYIIAIRLKLRSGATIDYYATNVEEPFKIGAEKLNEYIIKAKLSPGEIPELKTNFPTFYKRYCQEKERIPLKSEKELEVAIEGSGNH